MLLQTCLSQSNDTDENPPTLVAKNARESPAQIEEIEMPPTLKENEHHLLLQ